MKNRKIQNILTVLSILLVVLVFGMPYFSRVYVEGGDGTFHMARILSLVDSLQNGVFPPKIRPVLMKTYGYAVGIFYPDFFLYFPAAIKAILNIHVFLAWKIYFFIFLFVMGIVMWRCFTRLTGSRGVGIFGAMIAIGANTWLFDFSFYGGRVGTIHAMLFSIVTIIGLILALRDDKEGYLIYGAGLLSTLLSHHLDFSILMLFIFLYIILSADVVFKNFKVLLKIIGVSLIDMAISTAFWLPAMEQAADQKFRALFDNIYKASDNIFARSNFFREFRMLPFTIMFIISLVLFVAVSIYKKKVSKDAIKMNIMLIFFVWFTTSKLVWKGPIGEALSFFQYTYRFMVIIEPLFVMAIVFNVHHIYNCMKDKLVSFKNPYMLALTASLFIALVSYPVISDTSKGPFRVADLTEWELLYDRYNGSSGEEWLPVETQSFALTTPEAAKADDGSGADGVKYANGKWFDVWILMDKKYYDMPYVYYKGYHAYLLGDNNEIIRELEVCKAEDDNGLLRVYVPEGYDEAGHVMVMYRKTKIQKISYAITTLAVILTAAGLFISKRREKALKAAT